MGRGLCLVGWPEFGGVGGGWVCLVVCDGRIFVVVGWGVGVGGPCGHVVVELTVGGRFGCRCGCDRGCQG